MNNNPKPVELLAPAGSYEKLELAVHYGADAVYLAGKDFSLRNLSGNFTIEEIRRGIRFAHLQGVKVYVACNVFPKNHEIEPIADFLEKLGELNPDAVIIADPGVIRLARSIIPNVPIHLSTQANTTNSQSVMFWRDMGIKRINIARETTLREIKAIASATDLEIEAFGHGAMCIAVSGRCLLSSYMAGRSGNRGLCAHPCRWRYAVLEQMRPGQYMPVAEDEHGTYLFSAADLCMIDHLPELIASGVSSLKIEGRMKGIHYLATVVNVYRQAIDAWYASPEAFAVKPEWVRALSGVNSRGFSTGFYFGEPGKLLPAYRPDATGSDQRFLGKIVRPAPGVNGGYIVDVRNKFETDEAVEILRKHEASTHDTVLVIKDAYGMSTGTAKPGEQVIVAFQHSYDAHDMIRRRQA